MQQLEVSLDTPALNLACDEALLNDREAHGGRGMLRFWESSTPFIVLGYANRAADEVHLDAARARGIPVLRRCSGGGTVVQGPGCLNYSVILDLNSVGPDSGITATNHYVMDRTARALSSALGQEVTVAGHTDLAVGDRKFSGNAQRRKREWFLFHGTVLLSFDLALIGAVLKSPPREPEYRRQRSHDRFVTNLPLQRGAVIQALCNTWNAWEPGPPPPAAALDTLVTERYSRDEWNFKW